MIFYTATPTTIFPSGWDTNTPCTSACMCSSETCGSGEAFGVRNALYKIHNIEIEYASINTINSQDSI